MDVTAQDKIVSLLEMFIEEGDNDALDDALGMVEKTKFNITSLLQQWRPAA